jgi:pimeloyl-ACP methyl ester carboxylesterase
MGIGHFRSDEARTSYLAVYDRALSEWTTAPTGRQVETPAGETYVQLLGAPAGSPIVLLHAIAVSSPMWFRSIDALAERHPVYAIDTITDPGRSVQRAPVGDGADMASWLDDVLAALELDHVHLVGLSYGGWIALNQAQRRPARLSSVTAIDPPSAISGSPIRPLLGIVPDALRAKFGKSDPALRRLLARLNNGELPADPIPDLAIAGLRLFKSEAPRPKHLTDDELRSITTPTLLLLCGASPVNDARRVAERAGSLMPNVKVDVVEGAGHMLPVDDSAGFTSRVLGFVDSVEEGKPVDDQPPG